MVFLKCVLSYCVRVQSMLIVASTGAVLGCEQRYAEVVEKYPVTSFAFV